MRQGEYRRMYQVFRKMMRRQLVVDYIRNGVRMFKDENGVAITRI